MYDAFEDYYCYKATCILKNKMGIRNQEKLEDFEQVMFTLRVTEGVALAGVNIKSLKKLHHHLFQDVYSWSGKFRNVRISKNNSHFCYPEYIETNLEELFSGFNDKLSKVSNRSNFIEIITNFLSELNAIHPFREGNGRTQNAFLSYIVGLYGYEFQVQRIVPPSFIEAMQKSFKGDNSALYDELDKLII